MGILRYVEGVALLALVVLPLLLVARAAHRTWLSEIRGAVGVLAEIVVGLSLFITGSELVGLVGLFSIPALVIVFWLTVAGFGIGAGWSVFTGPPKGKRGSHDGRDLLKVACLVT